MLLETPADNVRAVRFYERQGYHILALKPDGRDSGGAMTSVRLCSVDRVREDQRSAATLAQRRTRKGARIQPAKSTSRK